MKFNSLTKSLIGIAAASIAAGLLLTSCGKKNDPTAVNSSVKTFTYNNQTSSSTTVNGTVTTADGSANIKVQVSSLPKGVNYVYITSSQDNAAMSAMVPSGGSFTDSLKNTFNPGSTSTYSYSVAGIASTKNFVLEFNVPVRTNTGAVSDVYTVWFTSSKGAYNIPTQHTVLGPITFVLSYGAPVPTFQSVSGIVLGDQTNSAPSLLGTSGQIAPISTSDYDTSASATASADLALCALNSAGTLKTNNSGILYLSSPSARASYNATGSTGNPYYVPTNPAPNVTYISVYTGSINFNNATGNDLASLNVGTSTQVGPITATSVSNGTVYQFQTASGKKGLILVTSVNATTASSGSSATLSIKVQN